LQPTLLHFPQNQVLHIADINVPEFFFAYILACWSYENGKNLPALLNLTKSVIVVHPNIHRFNADPDTDSDPAFFLIADPDPDPNDQNWKKNVDQKLQFPYP
jgi:hypothetical protein